MNLIRLTLNRRSLFNGTVIHNKYGEPEYNYVHDYYTAEFLLQKLPVIGPLKLVQGRGGRSDIYLQIPEWRVGSCFAFSTTFEVDLKNKLTRAISDFVKELFS